MTAAQNPTCELCGVGHATDRYCSTWLCRTCRDSGGDGILEQLGGQLGVQRRHRPSSRTRTEAFLYEVTITLPRPAPFQARFRSEAPITWLMKRLPWIDEATVGDPLFDDSVYVAAARTPALERFVASPTVQDALVEICTAGTVLVDATSVTCAVELGDDRLEADIVLPCVLLAHRLIGAVTPSSALPASPSGTA